MPRGKGRIRRITLEDGSLSFQVDAYDAWGKRIRRQFRDRADAEAFLNKIRHEKHLARLGVRPEKMAKATVTLSEALARFLEWAKSAHSIRYLEDEAQRARFWIDSLGDIPLSDLSREKLLNVLQHLAETRSHSTANRYLAVLRSALNKCVEWGILDANPCAHLKPYKEPPGRVKFLKPEEAEALLQECSKNPKLYMFVALSLGTGMRRGEMENLLWEDVDLDKGIIRVRNTKTRQARFIPIPKDLKELMRRWPRQGERVLGPFRYKKSFMAACRRAGLSDFRFHDLRHTYASWKVQDGVDLRTVAELLGHRTLAMVMRYSHLSPEHTERAREKGVMVSFRSVEIKGKPSK